VKAQPVRFVAVGRVRWCWPVLWAARDTAKDHEELAEKLHLAGYWPIKPEGAISLTGIPNSRVMLALWDLVVRPRMLQDSLRYILKAEPEPFNIEFPPLTKDPASIDFWWKKGIKPILEAERAWLGTSGALKDYLKRADTEKKKSCKDRERNDDPYRAKAETKAWNGFLTDCNQALLRLAPRVTDKTHKKP